MIDCFAYQLMGAFLSTCIDCTVYIEPGLCLIELFAHAKQVQRARLQRHKMNLADRAVMNNEHESYSHRMMTKLFSIPMNILTRSALLLKLRGRCTYIPGF